MIPAVPTQQNVHASPIPTSGRPEAHFTPAQGWINDPHGLRFVDGLYVLHYQSLPHRTAWGAEMSWGTAVSEDLVHWRQVDPCLTPAGFEVGCWSGCIVTDDDGRERAFYTRVRRNALDRAQVAVARRVGPGLTFASGEDDVVIDGPPDGAVLAFRDPFIWRNQHRWVMIVGAGLADGQGAVLTYESTDLDTWDYVGVLAQGRALTTSENLPEIWECPQMIQYADQAILIISVALDGKAHSVLASVGELSGTDFTVGSWQRLIHGPHAYATTVFLDRDGLPCMMSWLRDVKDLATRVQWVGALSLASTLKLTGGTIAVEPHDLVIAGITTHPTSGGPLVLGTSSAQGAYRARLTGNASATIIDQDETVLLTVTRSEHQVTITPTNSAIESFEAPKGAALDLFIDRGIVEIYSGGNYGAWDCAQTT